MPTFFWREHEMGSNPRIRLWTTQSAAYGQFDVLDHDDFVKFKELCEKYHWSLNEAED